MLGKTAFMLNYCGEWGLNSFLPYAFRVLRRLHGNLEKKSTIGLKLTMIKVFVHMNKINFGTQGPRSDLSFERATFGSYTLAREKSSKIDSSKRVKQDR